VVRVSELPDNYPGGDQEGAGNRGGRPARDKARGQDGGGESSLELPRIRIGRGISEEEIERLIEEAIEEIAG